MQAVHVSSPKCVMRKIRKAPFQLTAILKALTASSFVVPITGRRYIFQGLWRVVLSVAMLQKWQMKPSPLLDQFSRLPTYNPWASSEYIFHSSTFDDSDHCNINDCNRSKSWYCTISRAEVMLLMSTSSSKSSLQVHPGIQFGLLFYPD